MVVVRSLNFELEAAGPGDIPFVPGWMVCLLWFCVVVP